MHFRLTPPRWLQIYRLAVVVAMAVLVHHQAQWVEAQRAGTISLRIARDFFSQAHRVQWRDPERGLHYVLDAHGDTIGCLLTTSPQTDDIIGYSGPNDLLIALDQRGAVVGVQLRRSGDTPEHVAQVKADGDFWRTLQGWQPAEGPPPVARAVSGATLTSLAIVEAVQQRLAGAAPSLRFPEPVTLAEIQTLFTNGHHLVAEPVRWRVLDATNRLLGFALRTSPQADNVGGYRGPTECLVAVGPDGRTILDLRIRRSYDTDSYVDQIRVDRTFLRSFIGRTLDDLAALDFRAAKVEGVSGATQTSFALAEGLKRRAAAEQRARARPPPWRPAPRDWALAGVVAGAFLMAFTSLRGRRWPRRIWQLVLLGYVGLTSHDLLSLALFQGWTVHGIALRAVPGLVVLAAAALLTPWISRRQLYCHQICPHGAAQQWLGTWRKLRWSPPAHWTRRLERLPALILGVALLAILSGVPLNLSNLEPFDAWSWRTAGAASLVLAGAGLIASIFIPQAYCRFGCPTGALLGFIRSAGSGDRWGHRDSGALVLLLIGLGSSAAARHWPRPEPAPEPTTWSGRAMGMAWSVKTFDEVADPPAIARTISNELAWVESMISHWRPETDLSAFNRAQDTNALPVPWPVITLARQAAEIGRATSGALDITVGPLVRLWGFGPTPRRNPSAPPAEDELKTARTAVGWDKLEISDGLLRKLDPRVEVDLSSLAEGWAIDHLTRILQRRGYTNLLVSLGGEIRAAGRWPVAIEHPTRTCVLVDEAIGTAGTYRERRPLGPVPVSHLIDPRTGRPVTHRTVSVSVRHPDAVRADAWATALNVLGVDEGRPLAERLGLAAQFVVEDADNSGGSLTVHSTPAWQARVAATEPR